MRNDSNAGRKRAKGRASERAKAKPASREDTSTHSSKQTSAGVALGSGFESETAGHHKANAATQTEPPADTTGGSASGDARPIDRRAMRRILTWLLETTTEQQSLILSAMEIVSGPLEGSAYPNDRTQSPGALLRATLAERIDSVMNHSVPRSPINKPPNPKIL